MCIRERLRAVSTVRQCTVELARSTCPCPLGGPPIADRDIFASTDDREAYEGAGAGSTRDSTTGTHADSMSKILSSRAQCEAISVFLIKHQLALVSVYKKWESAPAPLLSIAHISRALHKDSASVDNRRWAWRAGT